MVRNEVECKIFCGKLVRILESFFVLIEGIVVLVAVGFEEGDDFVCVVDEKWYLFNPNLLPAEFGLIAGGVLAVEDSFLEPFLNARNLHLFLDR